MAFNMPSIDCACPNDPPEGYRVISAGCKIHGINSPESCISTLCAPESFDYDVDFYDIEVWRREHGLTRK